MDKIISKSQKIFAGASGPTGNISQFGSYKAGGTIYSEDVATIQNLSAWTTGLTGACSATNVPTIQDLNGLFYVLTRQLAYLMQSGIPEWKATITYYIGSFVTNSTGQVYVSLTDDNLNQALTVTTQWMLCVSSNVTTIGATYSILSSDYFLKGTSANLAAMVIPGPTGMTGRKLCYRMTNSPTGSMGLICTGSEWLTTSYFDRTL
jgi:hypothetical protein